MQTYSFNFVSGDSPVVRHEMAKFLSFHGLLLDPQIEQFVEARYQGKLVGCAGLDHHVIKCVAVAYGHQGTNLSTMLLTHIINYAYSQGRAHLFLYTKPDNVPFFSENGFFPIVTIPDKLALLENSPSRFHQYCRQLSLQYRGGNKIAAIVLNANPFTLGHRYLIEQAMTACDYLHVFPVLEESALFSYDERIMLIKQGIADLDPERLVLHAGSPYIISKATFPSYFLKDKSMIDACYTALDLMIFRQFISPSLGINYRFVGCEPFDMVTNKYNQDMKYWLTTPKIAAPTITVCEIPRLTVNHDYISASAVRKAYDTGNEPLLKRFLPASTWRYLLQKK